MTAPPSDAVVTSSPQRQAPRAAWISALALIVGLLLTLGATSGVVNQVRDAQRERFARNATLASDDLRRSLINAGFVLRSAQAFIGMSVITESDSRWRSYVAGLSLDDPQSSIRSLGIADAATSSDDPSTRRALQHTTASRQPALAARLVQDEAEVAGNRPDLALYLALPGRAPARFVYAALDTDRLLSPALLSRVGIEITTDHPSTTIFSGGPRDEDAAGGANVITRNDTMVFGGTVLQIRYSAQPADTRLLASCLAVAGMAGSLAGAGLIWLSLTRRSSTHPIEPRNPLSEARMMGIIRSSMEAIITIDEQQSIVIFNPAAERVFGVSAMEAIGAPLARFIPERFRAAHARHVDQFGVTGVSERQMGHQRVLFGLRGDGTEFPIEASISQIRDGGDKLYTVMLRDVTERLRAENALKQSREELRELSANLQNIREEEKTRIARELHDDLGQRLTALKMDLSAIEHGLAPHLPEDNRIRNQLSDVRRLIDATVASVRRIASDLRPVMLDDLGLIPAIEWLAIDFRQRYGIELEKHIDPVHIEFSSAGATALFRIVQEALTNVARHANATHVRLALMLNDTHCTLSIADNGNGHVPDASSPSARQSFGLIGIRERAHMLDGSVDIDSPPGKGFTLTVTLPRHTIQQDEGAS